MNSIDASDVEKKYRSTAGDPAYSRRMLLRRVIMASIDAVWSSRKIAKQAQKHKGKKVEDSQYSKINMKFWEFLTRGIDNVRNVFYLVCTAHNMKVMWTNYVEWRFH